VRKGWGRSLGKALLSIPCGKKRGHVGGRRGGRTPILLTTFREEGRRLSNAARRNTQRR